MKRRSSALAAARQVSASAAVVPEIALITPETPELYDATRTIFREYADGLGVDLCFQGFEAELAALPGLGRLIAQALMDQAVRAGYSAMLLDTLDDMEAARGLYVQLGFEEIPPYYFNPIPGAHYLKAQLG
jgi:ribosomal protein S18 acetylase RimI-like enzyme